MEAIIVTLIVGAIGGNLAGLVLAGRSLGFLWNTVVGVLGGGLGYFVLGLLGIGGAGLVYASGAAFVGGAILLLIIGLVRQR